MFGSVRLRAAGAACHELFVHSQRIRAATQGVYILNLCHVYVVLISIEIYSVCDQAVCEQQVIRTCRGNHFDGLSASNNMKCCGAVLKLMTKLSLKSEIMNSL